ncbi:flagellar hook-length control protein FliK [Antarcticirhabdus aurantiaca]|uniref:Flagellar hook-length control protein FliK n=1 Tax=Antarcticirhabdus aurantiaca TaxID=2606717 RepID=A0ACD4NT02_9HYPH|nr:flagellar hook-length control protein FliK [Antarcticirhabdus aurantiaca]WAJ29976.1 flagellar hook-length control protein FliK [Jeongeuplla avenae]
MTSMIVLADAGDPRPGSGRVPAQDRSKAGSAFDAALGAATKHNGAKAERHGHGKAADASAEKADGKNAADGAEAAAAQAIAEAEASAIAADPAIEGVDGSEISMPDDGGNTDAEGAKSLSSLLPDLRAVEAARVSQDAAAALTAAAQTRAAGDDGVQAALGSNASAAGLSPTMRLAKVLAASLGSADAQAHGANRADAASAKDANAAVETEALPMPTDDGVALASTPGAEIARAADAATLRAAAALRPADAGIATAKIDVVAMRTHFEPHRHDPVLVGDESGASSDDFAGRDEKGADELLSALGGAKSSAKASFEAGFGGQGGYGSPSSQIASAVASLVDPRDGHSSARGASEAGVLRYQAGGAALKSIRIQLQPEHLGKVDVSLRMVRGELAVEIATPLDATAAILSEDADGLKSLLRRAGFTLDDAAVTIVVRDLAASAPASTSSAGNAGGAGRDGSGQAGQGGSADGGSAGGGASGGESRRETGGREPGATRATAAGGADAPARSGGSLYL